MTDIGTNALFLSVYYGTSLLRNEFTATSSIHMKSVPLCRMAVPFMGTIVSLCGNERFSKWERAFLLMGTKVALHVHCIICLSLSKR